MRTENGIGRALRCWEYKYCTEPRNETKETKTPVFSNSNNNGDGGWEYRDEPSRNSRIDGTDLLLKEWEGLWSYQGNQFPQIGSQGEDRVSLLRNKMMINNHVHVVGEGIVGRVAFTDAHVWILQQNITGDQYPSEVLPEVYHQFSAGMQTVAAIPVLPHGVVQLGFSLTALLGF